MSDASAQPGYGATVAALATGQIMVWAAFYYAFSSFVLPMQYELGWSRATLMGANTLGLAMWGAASYAAGAAIDRGQGRWVLSGGTALGAVAMFGWARVSEPWMFYAVWSALGVAMALTLYDPAFAILAKRYPQRYRHGITMLTLVAGFASTLAFPAVAWLNGLGGWRWTLDVVALVLLLGVAPLQVWALRGAAEGARPAHEDPAADATLRQALRTQAFWLVTLCFTLYAFAGAALWAHVMPAFAAKGLTEAQALAVVVWIGPAQVAGRFVHAWIGWRWTLRTVGCVVLIGQPLALAIFATSSAMPALWAFALLFGLANGILTIVRGGLIPEYFGRSHVGRISGAMAAVGLLARASAPLGAAWALFVLPGYPELMIALAAMSVLGLLAFWAARPPRS